MNSTSWSEQRTASRTPARRRAGVAGLALAMFASLLAGTGASAAVTGVSKHPVPGPYLPAPAPRTCFTDIKPGGDGNLWYARCDNGSLGRINTSGGIQEASLWGPLWLSGPGAADGRMWFWAPTRQGGGFGASDMSMNVSYWPTRPGETFIPIVRALTAGADGNIYYELVEMVDCPQGSARSYYNKVSIGKLDPRTFPSTKAVQLFPIGEASTAAAGPGTYSYQMPSTLIAAPDGNLYFIQRTGGFGSDFCRDEQDANPDAYSSRFVRFNTATGAVTNLYDGYRKGTGGRGEGPLSVTMAANGEIYSVWVDSGRNPSDGQIAKIGLDGTITKYAAPGSPLIGNIGPGADGHLYLTNLLDDSYIGQFDVTSKTYRVLQAGGTGTSALVPVTCGLAAGDAAWWPQGGNASINVVRDPSVAAGSTCGPRGVVTTTTLPVTIPPTTMPPVTTTLPPTTLPPTTLPPTTTIPNQAPILLDDAAITRVATAITIPVLVNDTDPDGSMSPASVTRSSAPSYGTATVNPDGTITYTPNPGYTGFDNFTYRACDNASLPLCGTANVVIEVVATGLGGFERRPS